MSCVVFVACNLCARWKWEGSETLLEMMLPSRERGSPVDFIYFLFMISESPS